MNPKREVQIQVTDARILVNKIRTAPINEIDALCDRADKLLGNVMDISINLPTTDKERENV